MKFKSILLVKKFRSFFRQDWFFQILFIPTFFLLGLARMAVLMFKFTRIATLLGQSISVETQPVLSVSTSELELKRLKQISRLIITTSRYCPWKANCFAQAIVGRFWLGIFGFPYRIYFGLRRDVDGLKAHAWVTSGAFYVTGGNGFQDHTVVGCYCCKTCKDSAKARQ
ncbi:MULTISPECIES: lasso peptide biosynthesis B2 protein [Shewanella]|uniref:lasso peptide biosynthesis B2 protein n=1 Tax=Shewanella TaxID=22 RepID=UPI003AAE90D7